MLSLQRILCVCGLLFAAVTGLYAAPAAAQATRTWISGVGDDVNPCSRTAPCKTFAGAISKTAAGGEINCLDPGGFGAVTITKSIVLDCSNTLGGVLASSTTGILINAADVDVVIRGLTIDGGPPTSPGLHGVRFLQGATLTIIDSFITNFGAGSPNGNGIAFVPSTNAKLIVINTSIANNRLGILISPTGSGVADVTLDGVTSTGNATDGLRVATTSNSGPGVFIVAKNSIFSANQNGISLVTPAGTNYAVAKLINSTVSANSGYGVLSDGATVRADMGSTTVTNNGTGVAAINGGYLFTYLDNLVDRNGVDGTFSGTITKK